MSKGWVGFDYAKGLGCPVKVINDAAMQAIGSYEGGRMLFLGLGTGLGSAMIVDGIVEPMELAHLPYKKGKTYEDYLGLRGLKLMGKKKWRRYVARIVEELQKALEADYVVLGGGNVKKIKNTAGENTFGREWERIRRWLPLVVSETRCRNQRVRRVVTKSSGRSQSIRQATQFAPHRRRPLIETNVHRSYRRRKGIPRILAKTIDLHIARLS